ncbi:MAG: hypothetical protein RL168_602 [Bacteroidota bacterium]|jgi:phospholipase/carboxylesterase
MTDSPLALQDSRYAEVKDGRAHAQEIWLLHGYASHQDDLHGLAPYLTKQFTVRSLRATYPLDMGGYAWYSLSFDTNGVRQVDSPEAFSSVERVKLALEWHAEAFPHSPRPILVGFSQGGILSNAIGYNHPHLVRGIAAIASYFPWEWEGHQAQPTSTTLPFWAAIGSEDGVVPASLSVPTYERAQSEKGMNLTFKTYPMPHTISPACFADLNQWLVQLSGS